MLLRASGLTQNRDYDLKPVTGAAGGGGGIAHGRLLIDFAETVLGEDEEALDRARAALQSAIGPAGLVDAAGVIGLFNAIDRIADATGIPLEAEKAAATVDLRFALGLDGFDVATRA